MHNEGMRSALVACVLLGCGFQHGVVPDVTGGGAAGFVMIGCSAPTFGPTAIVSPDFDAW